MHYLIYSMLRGSNGPYPRLENPVSHDQAYCMFDRAQKVTNLIWTELLVASKTGLRRLKFATPNKCPYGIKRTGCTGTQGPWCGYCYSEFA